MTSEKRRNAIGVLVLALFLAGIFAAFALLGPSDQSDREQSSTSVDLNHSWGQAARQHLAKCYVVHGDELEDCPDGEYQDKLEKIGEGRFTAYSRNQPCRTGEINTMEGLVIIMGKGCVVYDLSPGVMSLSYIPPQE